MSFIRPFAAPIVIVGPIVLLILGVIAAALATLVLDHDILGRDADGWPVLYKTPTLRYAVDIFHAAIVYLLPFALAIGFLSFGRRLAVREIWIMLGGLLVLSVGSVHVIEAVWTGVKGTSDLRIGIVDDPLVFAFRLIPSASLYLAASFYFRRRAA